MDSVVRQGVTCINVNSRIISRRHPARRGQPPRPRRSEEHTSELQSLMRISYAVFCLKKKKATNPQYAYQIYSYQVLEYTYTTTITTQPDTHRSYTTRSKQDNQ